ncbi:MAG: 2Fe-2S iron-sulfur cluster-binding protein [bacterium]
MENAINTILLLEDDPTHARLIKEKLHGLPGSMIIEPAASAEECFSYLEKAIQYDLIILDLELTRKNGLEVLQKIRGHYKKPVIVLIGHRNEMMAADALRLGATHCIIKTEDYIDRLPLVVLDRLRQESVFLSRVILEYRPREDLVQFTINEQAVMGMREETVLDVANRYGIHIPTLCYHPAVSSLGACRICLVEVSAGKITRLYPSCMYPVQEGIIVTTDTERVIKTRRMIFELLMARCPGSDVIENMAKDAGVAKSRFMLRNDPDACILCGLCVRVCEQNIGASAIGFVQRGINRRIGTPFLELTQACTGCGECAKICPTGAITLDYIDRNIRKKRQFKVAVKCDGCAGYSNRACVHNCPTGALKIMTIEDFISKNKGSINVELRELLKYSLEGAESGDHHAHHAHGAHHGDEGKAPRDRR